MIPGADVTGLKRAFSSLLLFLMLLVSSVPFLNSFTSLQPVCDAKCCRSKQSCCCRKKTTLLPEQQTISMSARACPPGCTHLVGIASVSLAQVGCGIAYTQYILGVGVSGLVPLSMLVGVELCFSLFQRPPPNSLLPFTV